MTYDIVTPLSAHEPVILYQVVRNDSDNRAFVDLGCDRSASNGGGADVSKSPRVIRRAFEKSERH